MPISRDLQDHSLLGEAGEPLLFPLTPALLCFGMSCLALFREHCSLCASQGQLSLATIYTFSRTHPMVSVLPALATNRILGKAGSFFVPCGSGCLPWPLLLIGGVFIMVFRGLEYLLSAFAFWGTVLTWKEKELVVNHLNLQDA